MMKVLSSIASAMLGVAVCLTTPQAEAQSPKGKVDADAPPPALTYHGLIPSLHTGAEVRAELGEPEFESTWYDYKLYYPAEGRAGLFDVVHLRGKAPESQIGDIEAASVPEGFENESAIRAALGEPEFELRMATWKLLDYTHMGVRFTLSAEGSTTGVAYVPHGFRRVPKGGISLIDLSRKRQGPQSAPSAPAPMPSDLRAGVAEVTITPTGAEWLAHPYTVHDDLKARILVIRTESLTVAWVGADLFGMGSPDVHVIREHAGTMGIDHLVFAMSHNHAAPDTIGVYGHYPAEYIDYIRKQVGAGLGEALENLRSVGAIRSASRELPMDGARVADLFRNARNPAVLDPQLAIIEIDGEDGEAIATIVNFACHVESLSKGPREISADFPGTMCERIRADGGGQPIFLNGALGGMVSGDNRERTQESSRQMGLALAEIVRQLREEAQPGAEFQFSADRRSLEIPMTNPAFRALNEAGLRPLHRGRVLSDMIYIRLGEAQMVTLPGELLPEVGYEIMAHMDGFPRMMIGLANDQLGYMIPPYDFREGFYEESMSVAPSAALIVRDTAIRLLNGEE